MCERDKDSQMFGNLTDQMCKEGPAGVCEREERENGGQKVTGKQMSIPKPQVCV